MNTLHRVTRPALVDKTRLIALALAIVLPAMLGALWGLNVLYQQAEACRFGKSGGADRGVATVVDASFARMETTLTTSRFRRR